ncbi:MAG TPA: hypothetical protein PKH24_05280 [Sedimentisphaerales bacterium]|jgi:hypothetical protein|nr:hypothetical protein [Sedimentisphaerales bacterium]HNU29039.1 hypothetical protein [Sedimentisphaerales bacterium]
MKTLNVSTHIVFCALLAAQARADFTFGDRVPIQSTLGVIDPAYAEGPDCFSADGLEMYIESDRPGGSGGFDLWVSKRTHVAEGWGPLKNMGSAINSSKDDNTCSLAADGLTLYFASSRSNGYGGSDLWHAKRTRISQPWGQAVNLGSRINTDSIDACPRVSSNGLELYFDSSRPGGSGGRDLYVLMRGAPKDAWGDPVNVGPVVNSAYGDMNPTLSPDGLLLLFTDSYSAPFRPGGHGDCDVWMTRRTGLNEPWQTPSNLGPPINTSGRDVVACMSPDGLMLYGGTLQGAVWEMWQAPILPIVDFNADRKVDLADMALLMDHWGTGDTLYDIGPYAWGDGKVDVEDLKVFIAEWEKENPHD